MINTTDPSPPDDPRSSSSSSSLSCSCFFLFLVPLSPALLSTAFEALAFEAPAFEAPAFEAPALLVPASGSTALDRVDLRVPEVAVELDAFAFFLGGIVAPFSMAESSFEPGE